LKDPFNNKHPGLLVHQKEAFDDVLRSNLYEGNQLDFLEMIKNMLLLEPALRISADRLCDIVMKD